jgi:RTX calcium-binding nonapeptide repeat (4 copies)
MRILLIALLAAAALPAAADAATVSRTGGTLRYEAGKGERISGSVIETGGGAFLARSDKRAHQRLVPGAGCKRGRAHELRCAGQGVARVQVSLKRARTSSFFMVQDVAVAVAAVGSAGTNSMLFTRTPEFTYDGGPKRDEVAVRESPGGHSTLRLGAGADFFDGQPPALGTPDSTATFTVDGGPGRDYLMPGPGADSLDGGTGSDTLVVSGGADTLTGGGGADTVSFGSDPNHDNGPISVTLDGQRNDGTAGQDALVGSDIENAGIGPTSPPSDAVLVGNDGPNVLVAAGTVRGLGGNDTLISNNLQGAGTTLDGGDGDDRIAARAWDTSSASFATTPASVACGAGADIVFTNAAAPADCERVNVGMHVLGARSIGRNGVVRARIGCSDPRGCMLRVLLLERHGHEASIVRIRVTRIPFGQSRMASARILPQIWKRRRHGRSLRVKIEPIPQSTRSESAAGPIGSYPRALTLRIRH